MPMYIYSFTENSSEISKSFWSQMLTRGCLEFWMEMESEKERSNQLVMACLWRGSVASALCNVIYGFNSASRRFVF